MAAVLFDRSSARTAREVDELLSVLQGELDSTKNPHRVALRSLGLERLGWTRSVYSDEAFRIWGERLRRDPDDLETLHHLAIMHHARAMDLEAGVPVDKRPSGRGAGGGSSFVDGGGSIGFRQHQCQAKPGCRSNNEKRPL